MEFDEFITRYEYEINSYFAESGKDREYEFDQKGEEEKIYNDYVERGNNNIYDCFWK